MSTVDINRAKIVAKNLKTLMDTYRLTVHGVEAGAGIEVHTLNRILNLNTNISPNTAQRLADFFGIGIDQIFSSKMARLRRLDQVPTLKNFYVESKLNKKYFQDRVKEDVVTEFLKAVMLLDPFFNTGKRAKEITDHINGKYDKDFNSKTVAKVLSRLWGIGLLKREDRTGKGKVFYYSFVKPMFVN
ncbi:helix-turn-helix domain-containing protein [Olivibacter sitiensis]|uniref:helix-turn-helix domain-containing protein n=1 Tax=Olivibacter sitiensis TaxID=376470 RepID=UPI00047F4BF8|nr:helix-turn-helix domain-containing protein [Olivibacter sitiensis]